MPRTREKFSTHDFSKATNNPEAGSYANLLNPFLIEINNAGNNTAPGMLQNQITAKGALAILTDSIAKI